MAELIAPEHGEHVNRVQYRFLCADVADEFVVTSFEATEELNRPYRVSVWLSAESESTDTGELLGREAHLAIVRGDHSRFFYGVVCRVTIRDDGETRQTSKIELAPALSALRHTRRTRIFQDRSALDIVTSVLREGLAPYDRELDAALLNTERYVTRDYCVQYAETDLDFVHRLLEEEGIGYFFSQEEPEKLILFDDNAQAPQAETMNGGPVPYLPASREWVGTEPLMRFCSTTQVGSTSLVVRDHDWRRGRSVVEGDAPIGGEPDGPAGAADEHEVYQHGFRRNLTIREDNELLANMMQLLQTALMPNGMPGGLDQMVFELDGALFEPFTTNDLAHQLSIRRELLNRDSTTRVGVGAVMGFGPGNTFEVLGHPTLGLDGEYLITKIFHSSQLTEADDLDGPPLEAEHVNYHNRFDCIPIGSPWRPDRVTEKPRIYGVQTAKVTGPMGMDVYTDAYGRIRVKFPWDRAGDDPSGNYTCWMRVAQTWAGHGSPSFSFIPRVGMEVIVSFVDGDPDRPMVTGCVHNGENPTPQLLPVQATKSIIRTRTVPHGPGHNEISFEDAMGMERVHIRAERDLDELVLQHHLTDVKKNQSNKVGGNQYVQVGQHQRVFVSGNREQQVEGKITEFSGADYVRSVGGSGSERYGGSYELAVEGGSALTNVEEGGYVASAKGTIGLIQNRERMIKLASEGDETGILINSRGALIHVSEDKITLKVGSSSITIEDGKIQVNKKTFPP